MFNREVFYRQLDEVYERRDLDAIEQFLLDTQRRLSEESAYNTPSCDLCITPADRIALNSSYVKNLLTVQNELLSLYRGINRFEECLRISSAMKEEMADLGLKKTDQYAILLLNEGTAYRMMGRMEDALADFDECGTILQNCRGTDHALSPVISTLLCTCLLRILWTLWLDTSRYGIEWVYYSYPVTWLLLLIVVAAIWQMIRKKAR